MTDLQEKHYVTGIDYRKGSPHLSHLKLYDRLVEVLRRTVQRLADQDLPLRVLEIGAGHGAFTEPALALGCDVNAIDMSGPSIEELRRRFCTNPKFKAIYDPDGTLRDVDENYTLLCSYQYSTIFPITLLSSGKQGADLLRVERFLRCRTRHGTHGTESPIALTEQHTLAWRLGQGDLSGGLQTRLRRMRRIFDETNPRDMVEYHVVRNGVDEQAVLRFAREAFAEVSLIEYWSSQLSMAQHLGERLGLHNSFGIVAYGHH